MVPEHGAVAHARRHILPLCALPQRTHGSCSRSCQGLCSHHCTQHKHRLLPLHPAQAQTLLPLRHSKGQLVPLLHLCALKLSAGVRRRRRLAARVLLHRHAVRARPACRFSYTRCLSLRPSESAYKDPEALMGRPRRSRPRDLMSWSPESKHKGWGAPDSSRTPAGPAR